MEKNSTKPGLLPDNICRIFTETTVNVLQTITGLIITPHEGRIQSNKLPDADIFATMEFSGRLGGFVTIAVNKTMAATFLSAVIGCEPSELSEAEIFDGIGEIINQITGNIRTNFYENGENIEITIPEVSTELPQITIPETGTIQNHTLVFDCMEYSFSLHLCLRLQVEKVISI